MTPGGLITPIIRKAETKSLSTISAEMKDRRARPLAKTRPEEQWWRYHGGFQPRLYGIGRISPP
jgi:hypothetical protein